MHFPTLNNDIRALQARNRGLATMAGVLSFALLAAMIAILNILGTERTIVVPPTINKSFWVTGSSVSAEYLEQMGSFIAWLILDVSPSSIEWKKEALLPYVTPKEHEALKNRQDIEAERIKRLNANTYFLPSQLVPSESDQSVVIRGRLRTQVNGQETSTEPKAYLVKFEYTGGRIQLQTFKEIPNATLQGARAAAVSNSAQ